MTEKTRTLDNSHFLCLPTMCFYLVKYGKKIKGKENVKKIKIQIMLTLYSSTIRARALLLDFLISESSSLCLLCSCSYVCICSESFLTELLNSVSRERFLLTVSDKS